MTPTQRIVRIVKGLVVLVGTVGALVAIPVGLVGVVGWPLPTTIPSIDEITMGLRSSIDPQLVIKVLAVILWIAWTQLVIALTVETAAVVRGKMTQPAAVLPGFQQTAARIVATVALLIAAIGPIRQPAMATAPAGLAPTETITLEATSTPPASRAGGTEARASTEAPVVEYPTYTTGRFDTLWSIAQDTLGDGTRWRDIRNLNTGHTMKDGTEFTDTTERIAPGWTLKLPTDATLPTNTTPPETARQVTVEPGDSFWTIAEDTLTGAWNRPPTNAETTGFWRELVDLNRDRLRPPHDPDLIWPGQVFHLPKIPTDPTHDEPSEPTGEPSEPGGEVTVERGDHFWSIAQDTLQAGWGREVSDAEIAGYWSSLVDLNRDRLQPPYDSDLIYPGQQLQLPDLPTDPTDDEEAAGGGTPPPDIPTEPDPPPTDEPAADPDAGESGPLNPPDDTPDPASVVAPGDEDETAPTSPVGSGPPATTGTGADESLDTDFDVDVDGDEDGEVAGTWLPVAGRLAGLGVLAAGMVALIGRLRGTQLRRRRPRTIPTPPPASTAPVETTLRTAAAPTAVELTNLALRSVGAHMTQHGLAEPDLAAVRIAPEGIQLLLASPHPEPPPGWLVGDDGRSWLLPTDTDPEPLRQTAVHISAPWPALTTVGHHDDTQILLNLEHPGSLQVTGDPDDVAATLATMAIELAASPLADTLIIYCVGFGDDLDHLERIHPVDDLDQAIGWITSIADAAADTSDVAPSVGRVQPGGDIWSPIVVLDPRPVAPDGADQLLVAANSRTPISAVVGYPTGQRWVLHIHDDSVLLDPVNLTLQRRNLTVDELTAVTELTVTARDLDGVPDPHPTEPPDTSPEPEPDRSPAPTPPATTSEVPAPEPAVSSQAPPDPPSTTDNDSDTQAPGSTDTAARGSVPAPAGLLDVRVLGNVRIEGLHRRFPRQRCRDVIVYLALHPNGVDPDALTEAIWPGEPPLPDRIVRYVSNARTTLGNTPTGEPYVPKLGDDGLYRLHPDLTTDLDGLRTHITEADTATDPDEQARHLHAALDLVQGPPFTGGSKDGYSWAHTEGLVSHATIAIDKAAHRLAEHALQQDDPDTATWAARKGILVTRSCEQCYRHLMRSGIAADNPTAVEAAHQQLLAITEADEGPEATDHLDPATVELYEHHRHLRYHRPKPDRPDGPDDFIPQ